MKKLSKRPYKNFIEFATKKYGVMRDGEFCCPDCGGSGRIVAPGSFNDPVEGYKMAAHINCPHCGGPKKAKGARFESEWKREYKKLITHWKTKNTETKRINAELKAIKSKLSKKEWETILEYA